MQPLISNGLCLRPFVASDAEAFAQAVNESVDSVSPWLPWCHAGYMPAEALQWFSLCERSLAEQTAYELGIFSTTGEFLGGIGLNHISRECNLCNLGYWVRQSQQGKGIAPRATRLLADFGLTVLGLTRIEIVAAVDNEPSRAVARKVGATFEGVARNRLFIQGRPVDAAIHALIPSTNRP
ncbi:GNAT family N-acetyltransferase [Zestomonas carbonaria]|uniref:Ribosomal N-acetyltransferase YdaF n=1 Tax=Zestomonas carbonaria TaxID=2762745 RepID=A0A7U7EMK5_9GAMM|nr:GNAT family protein [Pseudomonas carbonaria]CAD5107794.1 Putative ribosomal N-acetyltransferase YdaF [Pseudomonas carbonaria]